MRFDKYRIGSFNIFSIYLFFNVLYYLFESGFTAGIPFDCILVLFIYIVIFWSRLFITLFYDFNFITYIQQYEYRIWLITFYFSKKQILFCLDWILKRIIYLISNLVWTYLVLFIYIVILWFHLFIILNFNFIA